MLLCMVPVFLYSILKNELFEEISKKGNDLEKYYAGYVINILKELKEI